MLLLARRRVGQHSAYPRGDNQHLFGGQNVAIAERVGDVVHGHLRGDEVALQTGAEPAAAAEDSLPGVRGNDEVLERIDVVERHVERFHRIGSLVLPAILLRHHYPRHG